ncbi:MAG: ribokinase [Lachnospiraceae bacterium]|nr:ribokinase [Lachnospiraceae bacterium]
MNILNFGSCNIDLVYRLRHIVRPGETAAAESLSRFPGGKGLNQSIALSRAGASVFHAGSIGQDGLWLRDLLDQEGVSTAFLRVVEEPTGHAVIQVDEAGMNSILLFGGANQCVDEEQVTQVLSHFGPGDAVVLQNEISSLRRIIDLASERRMKVFLNPSPMDEILRKLDLSPLFCILLNETEAEALAGTADPEEFGNWLEATYPKLRAVLTLGETGSVYYEPGRSFFQPAFSVDAVDTTAAGDTFTGYFIAAVSAGKAPEEAMELASAAAALAVEKPGAAPSIPTMDEVLRRKPHLKSR